MNYALARFARILPSLLLLAPQALATSADPKLTPLGGAVQAAQGAIEATRQSPDDPKAECPGPDQDPGAAHPPFDISMLDRTQDPCEDFYQFACGGYLARTQIPDDKTWWSPIIEMRENVKSRLRSILEKIARGDYSSIKDPYVLKNAAKLGDFYKSCTDETSVEKNSLREFESAAAMIRNMKNPSRLPAVLGKLHRYGMAPLFAFGESKDLGDPTHGIAATAEGEIGLPEKSYYFDKNPQMAKWRKDYQAHVAKMLELTGVPQAQAVRQAMTIMKLETRIAEISRSPAEERDIAKSYHPETRAQLAAQLPGFDWNEYFRALGIPPTQKIDVVNPAYLAGLARILKTTPLEDVKAYLSWTFLNHAAPTLTKRLVDEDFAFNGKELSGQKTIEPRWKRCVKAADEDMGWALGKAYVDEYFGPEDRAKAEDVIAHVKDAMADNFRTSPWMDQATRAEALRKLQNMQVSAGYPDKWRSYDGLAMGSNSYFRNRLSASRFNNDYENAKIGKLVDRDEWGMTPPTVNAANQEEDNKIIFPAGILQRPYFDSQRDPVGNYGAFGMVSGHERTHGFDDQGRHLNADGALVDWWSPQSAAKFEQSARCIQDQFDSFAVTPDLHIDGKLTLGETIADQGGAKLSYIAWKRTPEAGSAPSYQGFTPDQQFFLAMIQPDCTKMRPEKEVEITKADPHPLDRFRDDGLLSNMPEFLRAFRCQPGSKMVHQPRCEVW